MMLYAINGYFHCMKDLICQTGMAIVMILLLSAPAHSIAQASGKNKSIPAPLWVKMMEDPNVNYYKAVKEYENFWKGKEKTLDEEHLMNKGTEPVKEHIRALSKKEIRQQRLMDYYRYECKRFENWEFVNKPYVQSDGHILTADERLKLWQQTKKDRQ